ncbi:MAG: HAD-IIB family hydrolase [Pseudoflavonifractor sp.]
MSALGKFSGVLLASDFDDTLYNSKLEVSAENVAAIEYFIREGGFFTVSTGRAHRTFTPYLSLAPINAPVILANGALLYDYEKNAAICERPLPNTALADLAMLSRKFPQVGIETYCGDLVYICHPNAYTDRHVKRVNTDWTEREVKHMPTPWNKAVLQADYPTLLAVQKLMQERWGDRYEAIFSNEALLECTAKNATKGGMVLELAKRLGVAKQDIYCVGDNQNDIPMLAVSAIPFAPENCAQAVKDWGATLVRACDDHAIAHIVEILDERYGEIKN